MSKTVEVKGWIFAIQYAWQKEPHFDFASCDMSASHPEYSKVCEHTLSFEVPADFSMQAARVADLNAQKAKLQAEFNARIRAINDEIATLQCLTFEPKESA